MPDDFDAKELTKTVDQHHADLLGVKKEIDDLKDKKLDSKICKAIQDSTHIQNEIKALVWQTVKDKLVWVVITLLALLLWDVAKGLLAKLISLIPS